MCGITGIISKQNLNILDILIDSLSAIENRGYDSMGICFNDLSNNFNIIKSLENSEDIKNKINLEDKSILGIGHTRWATHGGITINNCHPHISMNQIITIVHNGIINNYLDIKNYLQKNNYKFYSETDTEIIANYLEYLIINKNFSIEDAISNLKSKLDGTWALLILYKYSENTIYATRNGSPLLLAESDNYIMLSSETNGFLNLFNNYISLENNDIVKISQNDFKSDLNYTLYKLNNVDLVLNPSPFKYWTLKEINEQPISIMNSINNGARIKNNKIKLGGLANLENIDIYDHLIVFGCGTSYHVSMMSRYYFQNNKFKTIQYIDASEFSDIDLPNIQEKCIAIFCSQSGETYDLVNCLEICKKRNYLTIGIINVVDSLIARMVSCGVYMNCGKEVSVASTKSYTSSLIILSLIGMFFSSNPNYITNKLKILRNLNNKVTNILMSGYINNSINKISNFIINNNFNSIFLLGTKELFPTSKEAALKIKEISYLHAEAYPALSLKHGPFSLLDKNNITFLLIQKNETNRLMNTYNEIITRNTNCYIITDNIEIKIKDIENIIYIENLDYYKEIIFIIFFQKLAYKLAIDKNINPDKPKNLAKVVTVE